MYNIVSWGCFGCKALILPKATYHWLTFVYPAASLQLKRSCSSPSPSFSSPPNLRRSLECELPLSANRLYALQGWHTLKVLICARILSKGIQHSLGFQTGNLGREEKLMNKNNDYIRSIEKNLPFHSKYQSPKRTSPQPLPLDYNSHSNCNTSHWYSLSNPHMAKFDYTCHPCRHQESCYLQEVAGCGDIVCFHNSLGCLVPCIRLAISPSYTYSFVQKDQDCKIEWWASDGWSDPTSKHTWAVLPYRMLHMDSTI